jgi:hypothetical protein
MFKLNDLIISGLEVYSVPIPPPPRPSLPGTGAAAAVLRRHSLSMGLLLHTLAVGGLPLPGRRGAR